MRDKIYGLGKPKSKRDHSKSTTDSMKPNKKTIQVDLNNRLTLVDPEYIDYLEDRISKLEKRLKTLETSVTATQHNTKRLKDEVNSQQRDIKNLSWED